ncbi:MAG: membrane protein of unknown function [Promethearchaeota archaeon]|nr:MAG: membrane protein of unknown function [Candidatus Lokiarchaeota archaeon]
MKTKSNIKYALIITLSIAVIATLIGNLIPKTSNLRFLPETNDRIYSSQSFQFIEEFKASRYYISPESSPGENDDLFFSFMLNKNGNYTLEIINYPTFLTYTSELEYNVAFVNPSGSDLFYLSYTEINLNRFDNASIKLLTSIDKGKTWNTQIIKSYEPSGVNSDDLFNFFIGTGIDAQPNNKKIGVISWINQTSLNYFGSTDNGTSWTITSTIADKTDLGWTELRNDDNHTLELSIQSNGMIYALAETNSTSLTKVCYFESYNNGSSWIGPHNITCIKGLDRVKNPRMQVNNTSGSKWLMWEAVQGASQYISWAEFNVSQSLNISVPTKIVSSSHNMNMDEYDFFYDSDVDLIYMIEKIDYGDYADIIVRNCTSFISNFLLPVPLGSSYPLGGVYHFFNAIYNGQDYQFFFSNNYLGENAYEVYQYYHFLDNIYFSSQGFCIEFTVEHIFWNGKTLLQQQINTTMVKAELTVENTTIIGPESLFIILDNEDPSFEDYNQEKNYFNPQHTNITLSEIQWDLLPSESCESLLEIYKENNSLSSWQQITDNNWADLNPKIFSSPAGQLYIIYKTEEFGRNVLSIIKSTDRGVTWSQPTIVFESSQDIGYYTGAAWDDIVCVYRAADSTEVIYRSFDEAETFLSPTRLLGINPTSAYEYVSKIVFTNSSNMFLTLKLLNQNKFYLYSSNDLGLHWTQKYWKLFETNDDKDLKDKLNPDIIYEPVNQELYLSMPLGNQTTNKIKVYFQKFNLNPFFSYIDNPIQKGPYDIDYEVDAPENNSPKFLLSRNKTAHVGIRSIYIQGFQVGIPTYKEFQTYDSGDNWNGPFDIDPLNRSSFTSFDGFETFYTTPIDDDADFELFSARETNLVKFQKKSISSSTTSRITYDGLNDFDEYLPEGNYSFILRLIDNAFNMANKTGWFYVDYDIPQIMSIATDEAYPLPSDAVQIQVNATDNINMTVMLYYQRDGTDSQGWQKIEMLNDGNKYIATIDANYTSTQVNYYVVATDLAGNVLKNDNDGLYYEYHIPRFEFTSNFVFNEFTEYSSDEYHLISITIDNDNEFVKDIIFRYSTEEGTPPWIPIPLQSNSPTYTAFLPPLSGDTRTLYYQVVVIDQNNQEHILINTRAISFFPELPDFSLENYQYIITFIISAVVGVILATGYSRLKNISHEIMNKQQIEALLAESKEMKKNLKVDKNGLKKEEETPKKDAKKESYTPYSIVYYATLIATLSVFIIGLLISFSYASIGILMIIGSLLMSIFGYMILMSRDISSNIFFEKMNPKNAVLEIFQITLILANIILMIIVGSWIPWFNYYLLESTYNIGGLEIPKLYISIIGVFLTSLILVIITTYIQLSKTVKNIHQQREKGISDNLVLYAKDEESSRLITRMGYKTVVFLISVLIAVISTTNLLNTETAILLAVVAGPFAITAILSLFLRPYIIKTLRRKDLREIDIPFVDSKKYCSKCGEETYLQDRYCNNCGEQLIFENKMGVYKANCPNCDEMYYERAKYCTKCGYKL